MKRFKREESLRYEFSPRPLDTTFFISRVNGEEQHSSLGKGVIKNVSPMGLGLQTSLDLPIGKHIEITFELEIGNHTIKPVGSIVWGKRRVKDYSYGVEFISEDYSEAIIQALKEYPKNEQ